MTEFREAAELLGRMNAKVVDTTEPGGGGGKPSSDTLSGTDIAAALMGVPRGAYLLARVKYVGDFSCLEELLSILITRISRKARRKGWSRQNPEWFRGMAILALRESEVMPVLCRRCRGRREVQLRKPRVRWIECPTCGGTGRHQDSEHARAQIVGIPWESWRRTWRSRQSDIKAMVIAWQWVVTRHLLRQLRREGSGDAD